MLNVATRRTRERNPLLRFARKVPCHAPDHRPVPRPADPALVLQRLRGEGRRRGPDENDHENWLKADDLDTGDILVTAKKAIAQGNKINLSLGFKNQTSDWIFLKKHEMVLNAGGQELKPYDGKEKPSLVIEPDGKATLPLKFGGSDLHVEKMTLTFSGLYKAAAKGEVKKAADFQLPPSQNNVTAGNFECAVLNHKQETSDTTTKWECEYTGDGIGYVDASQIGVKLQTGAEYSNTFRKNKEARLQKGEKTSFTTSFVIEKRIIDMQFATMTMLWRDTFAESEIVALDAEDMDFELDEATTTEKNE